MRFWHCLIVLLLHTSLPLFAQSGTSYNIEQGFVKYHVTGFAQVGESSSLRIDGTKRLVFKDFGYLRLEEESRQEYLRGNLEENHFVFRYKKRDGNRVFDVDVENQQVLEYTTSASHLSVLPLDYNATISGVSCQFYEIKGYYQECRHQGVALFSQYNLLGVNYSKVATEINFASDVNETLFELPTFPANLLVLYAVDNTKQKRPNEISEVLRSILREVQELNATQQEIDFFVQQQESEWQKRIFYRIFTNQHTMLPQVFNQLQQTRECMQQASDFNATNGCVEPLRPFMYQANLSPIYNQTIANLETSEAILEQLNRDIFMLAPKIACINKSKNIADVIECQ